MLATKFFKSKVVSSRKMGSLLGMLAMSLGLIVLYGWHTHQESLIQVLPQFVPMQYNTALGFFVVGLSLLFFNSKEPWISLGLGAAAFLIGSLTIVEYVTGIDLKIDQLFMEHYITTETAYPGRMAPNTALCFTLSGIAVLFNQFGKMLGAKKESIIIILGALISALGVIALTGYLFEIESAYGWGALTHMAVHTSLGFGLLGAGFISRGASNMAHYKTTDKVWIIPTSCILMGVIALVDHSLPLGIAAGVGHIIVILYLLRYGSRRQVYIFVTLCSFLIILMYYTSPDSPSIEKAVINRVLSIIAIWSVAIIGLRAKRAEGELQKKIENEKMQAQVLQLQKMEAVGRLAGGVAHDFNNQLLVMSGYCDFLAMELEADDPRAHRVEEIKKAINRSAFITRQLLAFGHKQTFEPQIVDLNEIIHSMGGMFKRLIRQNIDFIIKVEEKLDVVKVDPGQIEQVLTNLVVNARDAIQKEGEITIETQNASITKEYTEGKFQMPAGDYVLLAVSDTGMGMDDKVKEHIFEPFFTTKKRGEGTGLGLATCYGIIRQSEGYIQVYSEKNYGTCFKIYLPKSNETHLEAQPKKDSTDLPVGTETILLVEDEDSVRQLSAEMLEKQGYNVLQAENASAALRLLESYDPKLNLLVTDVIMPGISGPELKEEVLKLYPGLKVLFISGYTDNALSHQGVLEEGIYFLQKPYTMESLVVKVREVIDVENNPPTE